MSIPNQIKFEVEVVYDFLEFKWSIYELKDGTILRLVNIPNKIFRAVDRGPQGEPRYFLFGQNTVTAMCEKKGEPNKSPFDPTRKDLTQIGFEEMEEPWNEFLLSDGTIIKQKTILTRVMKSEQNNSFGEPIYTVSSNNNIQVIQGDQFK